jgi:hypothetical protein
MNTPPIPLIPGWNVHIDNGWLIACRAHGLTEYMRGWGALDQLCASSPAELMVLCDAQTRLAERLATAQWLQVPPVNVAGGHGHSGGGEMTPGLPPPRPG